MILAFRLTAAVYALCGCALLTHLFPVQSGTLPDAAVEYWTWWVGQPKGSLQNALEWITLFGVLGSIAAALGMGLFSRPARTLFWICVTAVLACEPFADLPVLIRPIESFLQSLLGITAGAAIGLAHAPGIRERFARRQAGAGAALR